MKVFAVMRKAARAGLHGAADRALQPLRTRAERRAAARATAQRDLWCLLDAGQPELRRAQYAAALGESGRAAEILLRHAGGRAAVLPGLRRFGETIEIMRRRFPEAVEGITAEADRASSGRLSLFGWMQVDVEELTQWLRDPATEHVFPLDFHADVALEEGSPGNIRVLWEMNRHQHLVALARAAVLTGREQYADAIARHLETWWEQNPYLLGPNWASSLECSLRAISWLWARGLLLAAGMLSPQLNADLCGHLAQAASHIARHLSYTYAPNTHLLGEALGLLYLGALLPEVSHAPRWFSVGRRIILREAEHQFLDDGFHFEHSTWYHRFATDIYLHAAVLCAEAGRPLPATTLRRVEQMVNCLGALGGRSGAPVSIGDDDGGRLLPLCSLPRADCRDTMAIAAAFFGRGDLKPPGGGAEPAVLWLLGPSALADYEGMAAAPASSRSTTLPGVGVALMGGPEGARLTFRCGAAQSQDAAHDHADALSIQIHTAAGPVVTDTGTFTYTGAREWRDYFRGATAHSLLAADSAAATEPDGLFGWRARARVEHVHFVSSTGFDYAEATCLPAGRGLAITRRVLNLKRGEWLVCDTVAGAGRHELVQWFHFPPCAARLDESGRCMAETPGGAALIVPIAEGVSGRIVEGLRDPIQGWISDRFEERSPAPALCYSMTTSLPAALPTLICVDAEQTPPTVTQFQSTDEPEAVAFSVEWAHRRDSFLLAPPDGRVRSFGAFASDAAVAWTSEASSNGGLRVALCGGSLLTRGGEKLIELPRRIRDLHLAREGDSISLTGPLTGRAYVGWPGDSVLLNGRPTPGSRAGPGISIECDGSLGE